MPKDVVSGDFPWFFKKGNHAYIGAIDCTGHGVPGALIRMVTYFTLNNILNKYDDINPANILNFLHVGIKRTLKQHYDNAELKDGCDVGICKINLDTKELEYAGAGRPLIYISDNELQTFKGDRLSVGGYRSPKKKSRFKNYKIQTKKNDFFCVFSDGITDQFGPTEKGDMKIGGKRIREELLATNTQPLTEISKHLTKTLLDWKQDVKQTDDMLMIGLRL